MTQFTKSRIPHPRSGFSLLELLISMTILAVMMAAGALILSRTQETWTSSWSRTSQFRDARLAFELVTRNLSQATLNTYWDYVYDEGTPTTKVPQSYGRQSELHFYTNHVDRFMENPNAAGHAVFFQAILGHAKEESLQELKSLLNGVGYYVEYADDFHGRPAFLDAVPSYQTPKWRFRLMEYRPPSEENLVYHAYEEWRQGNGEMSAWFSKDLREKYQRPVVDNIVALLIAPKASPPSGSVRQNPNQLAPDYRYDSQDPARSRSHNQLPPLVEVTLIAIDEETATRIESESPGDQPPQLLSSQWFLLADRFEEDLAALEKSFTEKSYNYRIFSTTIAIRSAKWSS